jgi:hypothetical protein
MVLLLYIKEGKVRMGEEAMDGYTNSMFASMMRGWEHGKEDIDKKKSEYIQCNTCKYHYDNDVIDKVFGINKQTQNRCKMCVKCRNKQNKWRHEDQHKLDDTLLRCCACKCYYHNDDKHIGVDFGFDRLGNRHKTCNVCRSRKNNIANTETRKEYNKLYYQNHKNT